MVTPKTTATAPSKVAAAKVLSGKARTAATKAATKTVAAVKAVAKAIFSPLAVKVARTCEKQRGQAEARLAGLDLPVIDTPLPLHPEHNDFLVKYLGILPQIVRGSGVFSVFDDEPGCLFMRRAAFTGEKATSPGNLAFTLQSVGGGRPVRQLHRAEPREYTNDYLDTLIHVEDADYALPLIAPHPSALLWMDDPDGRGPCLWSYHHLLGMMGASYGMAAFTVTNGEAVSTEKLAGYFIQLIAEMKAKWPDAMRNRQHIFVRTGWQTMDPREFDALSFLADALHQEGAEILEVRLYSHFIEGNEWGSDSDGLRPSQFRVDSLHELLYQLSVAR